MTHIYFVRHAQSNNSVQEDAARPLTAKGEQDRELVSQFLDTKNVSRLYSSPFKRSYDTLVPFARRQGLSITTMDYFAERRISDHWIEDFSDYAQRQWADFHYKLPAGESLAEVQQRNMHGLHLLLKNFPGETIAVGTHGTALSTILQFYNPGFDYEDFRRIAKLMPWIVHFTFDGSNCRSWQEHNLFT